MEYIYIFINKFCAVDLYMNKFCAVDLRHTDYELCGKKVIAAQ